MIVSYSEAFKGQVRRLSRKYRRIRVDVQPLIERLEAAELAEIIRQEAEG